MSLVPCHSRRSIEGETALYFCAHPHHHSKDNRVTAEICSVCDYWRQLPPPSFRPYAPPAPPRGACLHLGDQLGLRDCPTCRGSVRVKVLACAHPNHEDTTLAFCDVCPDFQPRPTESPRPE